MGLSKRYIVLDLECHTQLAPAWERIHKIGALRTDDQQPFERDVKPSTLNTALQELDALADGCEVLLGHNILAFDLPLLRELDLDLSLLNLPVIDTLLLSPLAFPQNPYHRLIKDYKLIRDSLNSPLSDCRATQVLFKDQYEAFELLATAEPNQLSVFQSLMVEGLRNQDSFLAPSEQSRAGQLASTSTNRRSTIAEQPAFDQVADSHQPPALQALAADDFFHQFTRRSAPGWLAFFTHAAEQVVLEFGEHQPSGRTLIDWLYEYARGISTQSPDGLYIGTVHASKGLEFQHVVLLDGGWSHSGKTSQQERRLYYVGMTRAQQTLTVCRFNGDHHFSDAFASSAITQPVALSYDSQLQTRYQNVSLKGVDLGYAGSHDPAHPIHSAIAVLRVGDGLKLLTMGGRSLLANEAGQIVGRMASAFKPQISDARYTVAGIIIRYRSDSQTSDKRFAGRLKCDRWEVVVPAIEGL